MSFALSSLVSVTKEQLEALGDDELVLIIGRFSWFHNNRLNRRRCGDQKVSCYNCGDPDHFVTHCPKKNNHSFDKYDFSKHKDKCNYNSGKHKLRKGFDKEAFKKMTARRPRPKSLPSLKILNIFYTCCN